MMNLVKAFNRIAENKYKPFLFFLIIGLFIYGVALQGPFIWDDIGLIVKNESIQSLGNVTQWFTENFADNETSQSKLYRPIASFFYALIFSISGFNPLGYHLFNLLIHVCNTYLVFGIFKKLGFAPLGGFFAALIFLVHPTNTEAVAHIAGLPDVLSATIVFGGISILLSKIRNANAMALTCALFILGLLIKESTIILAPLAFFVTIFMWKEFSREEKAKAKHLVIALVCLAVLFYIARVFIFNSGDTFNLHVAENVYTESMRLRIITFISILWEYTKLIFFPVDLYFEKPFIAYASLAGGKGIFGLLVLAVGIPMAISSFFRSKQFFLGFTWFFAALAPVSGIIAVNSVYAERWLYIPIISVLLFIPVLFETFESKKAQSTTIIILLIITILLGARSFERNTEWANEDAFYQNELTYNQTSGRLYNEIGQIYFQRADFEQAIIYFEQGVDADIHGLLPEVNYNLASAYLQTKNLDAAINQYFLSLEKRPNFLPAHIAMYNVGIAIHNEKIEQKFLEFIQRIEMGGSVDFETEIAPVAD